MIGTTFDSVTTALADKMITHAENEINKYISKRYDISSFQVSVPPLVTSLCETLAEGYMHWRMSRGGKDSMARGKEMIKEVQSNLLLIQGYKADILDSSGSIIDDMSTTSFRIQSSTVDYHNTFNEDDPVNWGVDLEKLLAIEDERS
jgi:hypothetical protein